MNKELTEILDKISNSFEIDSKSYFYHVVDLGRAAKFFGYINLEEKYKDEKIIVPIKNPKGINIFVNDQAFTKSFKDYIQLSKGIIVAPHIAKEGDMSGQEYSPYKKMILVM